MLCRQRTAKAPYIGENEQILENLESDFDIRYAIVVVWVIEIFQQCPIIPQQAVQQILVLAETENQKEIMVRSK